MEQELALPTTLDRNGGLKPGLQTEVAPALARQHAIVDARDEVADVVAGSWLSPGRFALVLAGLIMAAFPQVMFGSQTFVMRDFGFFAYPLAHYQRECFWHGQLPLWDPYNNCGVPFLAQWNTMCLYPPSLIYLLLPLSWSLSFFCLFHLFWAGMGMYFLAHRWTGNRLAAALAGLVFAFNGLSLNMLMWPSHIATLSWMPWVVLSVQQAWQQGGRKIVLAALVGAMQMLAGGPETILFTWVILAVLWAVEGRVHSPQLAEHTIPNTQYATRNTFYFLRFTLHPKAWRFPLVILLVAALVAVQLLPFLDLASHSQRGSGYADARWSMPAWGWTNFLVPMAFGHVWPMGVFFQHEQSWTSSYYFGAATVALALLGVWTLRDRRLRALAVVAGVAFVFSLGDQTLPGRWLRKLIPQLGLMTYPIKYVTLIVFAAPLLAAFGLARLWVGDSSSPRLAQATTSLPATQTTDENVRARHPRSEASRLIFLGTILLALIMVVMLWAWRAPFPMDDIGATFRNGAVRAGFLVATLLLALGIGSMGHIGRIWQAVPRLHVLLPLVLLLTVWLDLWFHEPNQNPTVPAWAYEPGLVRPKMGMTQPPALGQTRAMVSAAAETDFIRFIVSDQKDNLLAKRVGCFADCNLLDDVPKVNGFFSIYPRECGELASVLYGSTNANFPRLADFMGVSQITAPGQSLKWLSRDSFLPLATAGQRPVFLDDTNAERNLISPRFDGSAVVFLTPESQTSVSVNHPTKAQVRLLNFSPERIDLEAGAEEPSLVVLSQTYYHQWRAYVDGQPTPLFRANYAFQAVEVPKGTHQVRLVYEDKPLRTGGIISALTLLGCGVASVRRRAAPPCLRGSARVP